MFAKVFSQIFDSSIAEDFAVRHVFIDLLILADSDGVVDMTAQAISRRTNVPLKTVKHAIDRLCQPDEESRSKTEEGRRLVLIDSHRDWGWHIVNYAHYRAVTDNESRRSYFRDRKRAQREKAKSPHPVLDKKAKSKKSTGVTQVEEDEDEEAKGDGKKESLTSSPPSEHSKFIEDWCKYYELRTKTKYAFQAGRDGKAVKLLLIHFGTPEAAKDFIKACHARAGTGFPFATIDTLSDLANNISRLQAALAAPPRVNGHGHRQTEAQRDQERTGLPPQEFNLRIF